MTYDCLVGTSIWLMLNRRSRTAIAAASVGISGTSIRRMFDGRWVATIVLIKPMRAASRAASSAEQPARRLRREQHAQRSGVEAEPQMEPVRGEALDDEAAAERVQREERGQLPHGVARTVDAGEPGQDDRTVCAMRRRWFQGVR